MNTGTSASLTVGLEQMLRDGKAMFSTNLGEFAPREARSPFTPIVLRSDPQHDKESMISRLEEKYPDQCKKVIAPTLNVYQYFDHYDVQLHGFGFLKSVLDEIGLKNSRKAKNVQAFVECWKTTHLNSVDDVTLDALQLFSSTEKAGYGQDFLEEALLLIKNSRYTKETIPSLLPQDLEPSGIAEHRRSGLPVQNAAVVYPNCSQAYGTMVSGLQNETLSGPPESHSLALRPPTFHRVQSSNMVASGNNREPKNWVEYYSDPENEPSLPSTFQEPSFQRHEAKKHHSHPAVLIQPSHPSVPVSMRYRIPPQPQLSWISTELQRSRQKSFHNTNETQEADRARLSRPRGASFSHNQSERQPANLRVDSGPSALRLPYIVPTFEAPITGSSISFNGPFRFSGATGHATHHPFEPLHPLTVPSPVNSFARGHNHQSLPSNSREFVRNVQLPPRYLAAKNRPQLGFSNDARVLEQQEEQRRSTSTGSNVFVLDNQHTSGASFHRLRRYSGDRANNRQPARRFSSYQHVRNHQSPKGAYSNPIRPIDVNRLPRSFSHTFNETNSQHEKEAGLDEIGSGTGVLGYSKDAQEAVNTLNHQYSSKPLKQTKLTARGSGRSTAHQEHGSPTPVGASNSKSEVTTKSKSDEQAIREPANLLVSLPQFVKWRRHRPPSQSDHVRPIAESSSDTNATIWVHGLRADATKESLTSFFGFYGAIRSTSLSPAKYLEQDSFQGLVRMAWITFESVDSVENVMKELDNVQLDTLADVFITGVNRSSDIGRDGGFSIMASKALPSQGTNNLLSTQTGHEKQQITGTNTNLLKPFSKAELLPDRPVFSETCFEESQSPRAGSSVKPVQTDRTLPIPGEENGKPKSTSKHTRSRQESKAAADQPRYLEHESSSMAQVGVGDQQGLGPRDKALYGEDALNKTAWEDPLTPLNRDKSPCKNSSRSSGKRKQKEGLRSLEARPVALGDFVGSGKRDGSPKKRSAGKQNDPKRAASGRSAQDKNESTKSDTARLLSNETVPESDDHLEMQTKLINSRPAKERVSEQGAEFLVEHDNTVGINRRHGESCDTRPAEDLMTTSSRGALPIHKTGTTDLPQYISESQRTIDSASHKNRSQASPDKAKPVELGSESQAESSFNKPVVKSWAGVTDIGSTVIDADRATQLSTSGHPRDEHSKDKPSGPAGLDPSSGTAGPRLPNHKIHSSYPKQSYSEVAAAAILKEQGLTPKEGSNLQFTAPTARLDSNKDYNMPPKSYTETVDREEALYSSNKSLSRTMKQKAVKEASPPKTPTTLEKLDDASSAHDPSGTRELSPEIPTKKSSVTLPSPPIITHKKKQKIFNREMAEPDRIEIERAISEGANSLHEGSQGGGLESSALENIRDDKTSVDDVHNDVENLADPNAIEGNLHNVVSLYQPHSRPSTKEDIGASNTEQPKRGLGSNSEHSKSSLSKGKRSSKSKKKKSKRRSGPVSETPNMPSSSTSELIVTPPASPPHGSPGTSRLTSLANVALEELDKRDQEVKQDFKQSMNSYYAKKDSLYLPLLRARRATQDSERDLENEFPPASMPENIPDQLDNPADLTLPPISSMQHSVVPNYGELNASSHNLYGTVADAFKWPRETPMTVSVPTVLDSADASNEPTSADTLKEGDVIEVADFEQGGRVTFEVVHRSGSGVPTMETDPWTLPEGEKRWAGTNER